MKQSLRLIALAALFLMARQAVADDLLKVDRTVKKQPVYRGKPQYCLLVFGHEAKLRVWLVVDDDAVFIDRRANGDLTEARNRVARNRLGAEAVFKPVSIMGRERRPSTKSTRSHSIRWTAASIAPSQSP